MLETFLMRINISTKLWAILSAAFLVLCFGSAFHLHDLRGRLLTNRQAELRHLTETAVGVLERFHGLSSSGALSEAEARREAIATIKALRYEGNEYFWLNDMVPLMVMHPFKPDLDGTDLRQFADPDGKRLFVEFVEAVKQHGGGFVGYQWPKPGADQPVPKLSYVRGFAPWGWVVGTGVYIDDIDAAFWREAVKVGVLGLLALIFLGAGAVLMARSITRPLASALEMAERVAEGDLSRDAEVQGTDEVSRMLGAMQAMVLKLREIVGGTMRSVDQVSHAADAIAQDNLDLSQRTDEQAASLAEVAASMEELTATVSNSAENAGRAHQLAVAARERAERGGAAIERTVGAMSAIAACSREIADIITVVDEMAFQTNLLALNAAVEAARAGEQGRGFAVVAGEVRRLAQRSAESAKQIKALINDTVAKVDGGSKLVAESGATLKEIVTAVKGLSDTVAEIAEATREQASGFEQINQAVTQMDQVTQKNAELVGRAAATGEEVRAQTRELQRAMAFFRHGEEPARAQSHRQRLASQASSRPQPLPGGASTRHPVAPAHAAGEASSLGAMDF